MTAVATPERPHPDGTPSDRRWKPIRKGASVCGLDHPPSHGPIDETRRRLTHEEFAVATQLSFEGHEVHSLPERRGRGRTADLEVCGTPVEVKSWMSLSDREGHPPTPRSVLNKLLDARDQAGTVVLNGRGSGLTPAAARGGMALYASRPDGERLTTVRVLGDNFDLGWSRRPDLAVELDDRGRQPRDTSQRIGHEVGLML